MRFAVGFDIFAALGHVRHDAELFNRSIRPGYAEFLVPNIREFFVNVGYAVSLVVLAGALVTGFHAFSKRSTPANLPILPVPKGDMRILTVGLLVEILALDLVGLNRGEVSVFLWLFIAVFMPLVVVAVTSGPSGERLFQVVLAASVIQTVFMMGMVAFNYFNILDAAKADHALHDWTWDARRIRRTVPRGTSRSAAVAHRLQPPTLAAASADV